MTKESIHQEDVKIVIFYVLNIRGTKCVKQILAELKGEIPIHIIIMDVDSTHLSITDRISKKKKSVHIRKYLSNTIYQLGLSHEPKKGRKFTPRH